MKNFNHLPPREDVIAQNVKLPAVILKGLMNRKYKKPFHLCLAYTWVLFYLFAGVIAFYFFIYEINTYINKSLGIDLVRGIFGLFISMIFLALFFKVSKKFVFILSRKDLSFKIKAGSYMAISTILALHFLYTLYKEFFVY